MTITREFLVMARHNLIPSWFAYVNGFTGTPLRITLIFGTIKGAEPCQRVLLELLTICSILSQRLTCPNVRLEVAPSPLFKNCLGQAAQPGCWKARLQRLQR